MRHARRKLTLGWRRPRPRAKPQRGLCLPMLYLYLDLSWAHAGLTLDSRWPHAGLKLALRWTHAGLTLDSCWTDAGPLDCCCTYDGPARETAMPGLTTTSMARTHHVMLTASTRNRNAGAHDGKHVMCAPDGPCARGRRRGPRCAPRASCSGHQPPAAASTW